MQFIIILLNKIYIYTSLIAMSMNDNTSVI